MPQRTMASPRQKKLARPRQTAVAGPSQRENTLPVAPPESPTATTGFMALAAKAEQEVLAVTYWFDPMPQPQPYPVTVKFAGHRIGATRSLQPGDQFVQYETIDAVIPGSGPLSLTATIHDITPGEWQVTAAAVAPQDVARRSSGQPSHAVVAPASPPRHPAARFWRNWSQSVGTTVETSPPLHTSLLPFARTPGIIFGAWIAFVIVGMLVALVLQSLVLTHERLARGDVGLMDIVVLTTGIVGAKVWFVVKEHSWEGWCIQGFVTGATIAAVTLLVTLHLPIGRVLDATAPSFLIGMAVGRIGCFFGGCCGGLPTASRWGVWSSDQRVGARRFPIQLLEAAFTASVGIVALLIVWNHGPVNGAVFVAALATYTLGRQGVLRLRIGARPQSQREAVTTALAALTMISTVVIGARAW